MPKCVAGKSPKDHKITPFHQTLILNLIILVTMSDSIEVMAVPAALLILARRACCRAVAGNYNSDSQDIMFMQGDLRETKDEIRRRVWRSLREKGVARFPFPIEGRIPNFVGAEAAASRLAGSRIYLDANVLFSNPDSPQRFVRELALRDGKTLVMASPRLRSGFILLDPKKIPSRYISQASTIRGAFRWGTRVEVPPQIDLKVTGSVAVTTNGARLGKGGGYSDLEYAILRELGCIDEDTPVVTTVHELQIVDYIPMTRHDVPVDYIFTPRRTIKTDTPFPKPRGIYPEELPREK